MVNIFFQQTLTYNFNSFKPSKPQKNEGADNEDGLIKLGQ